jgi:hypothetical protein
LSAWRCREPIWNEISEKIHACTGIQELNIESSSNDPRASFTTLPVDFVFPRLFKAVKGWINEFNTVRVFTASFRGHRFYEASEDILAAIVVVSTGLGLQVMHVNHTMPTTNGSKRPTFGTLSWTWKTAKDEVLVWNEMLYDTTAPVIFCGWLRRGINAGVY